MALDFSMLDSRDVPIKIVSIGMTAHQSIIELAKRLDNGQLVARMYDYYRDVDYLPSEIPILIQEIKAIRELAEGEEVISLLIQLQQMCYEALAEGWSVSVMAD